MYALYANKISTTFDFLKIVIFSYVTVTKINRFVAIFFFLGFLHASMFASTDDYGDAATGFGNDIHPFLQISLHPTSPTRQPSTWYSIPHGTSSELNSVFQPCFRNYRGKSYDRHPSRCYRLCYSSMGEFCGWSL